MEPDVQKQTYSNDVFISYSRKDKEFASKLEKALKSYKPPKDLNVPQRNLVVFRDEEDITGVEYHQSIEKHLKDSKKLIIVCSPDARKSTYVNGELRLFAKLHGAQNIIPILLSGIPNNEAKPGQEDEKAFPDALCEVMQMPLATSYLGFDPQNDKVIKGTFSGSWYTLLANIYDASRSEIEQREKKKQAHRRKVVASLVSGVIVFLSGLSIWALLSKKEAVRQRNIAQHQSGVAIDAFYDLTYDIPSAFQDFPGTERIRERLAKANINGLKKLLEVIPDDFKVCRELATNYRLWGTILIELNDFKEAFIKFKESADFYEILLKIEPENDLWHRDFAVSHYNAGLMLERLGDAMGACKEYGISIQAAQRASVLNNKWDSMIKDFEMRFKLLNCQ